MVGTMIERPIVGQGGSQVPSVRGEEREEMREGEERQGEEPEVWSLGSGAGQTVWGQLTV